MNNVDMMKKAEALVHIQASIDIMDNLDNANKETIEIWRYLKYARCTLAEDINRGARYER